MKKTLFLLPLCLAACFFAAGCGAVGIGTKGILRGIYLERQNGGYQVQLICWQGAPSADAADAEQTALLVEGQGATVREALQNAQQSRSEELFYGQNELLLIGPRLAQEGLYEAVEYLVRQETGRPNVTVYLTDLPAGALAAQPETVDGLLASVEQVRKRGGYHCYLYQLGDAAQGGLLPNLKVDLEEGAAVPDGLTVYAQGRPAHRWDQNQLSMALLLSGQQNTLRFTAGGPEDTVSFTLHSARAVCCPQQQGGRLRLEVLLQGDIRRVETRHGAQSPLADEQYEAFLRTWLADLARQMTSETLAEGNDVFLLRSYLDNLDAAAAERQARQGTLYQQDTVLWVCEARML